MTLRKLSILSVVVALCLCCFALPSFAAEDTTSTTVYFFKADGTYITLLQDIRTLDSTPTYRVGLTRLDDTNVYAFDIYYSTDMSVGEKVATYLYTLPDNDSTIYLMYGDTKVMVGSTTIVPTGEISSVYVYTSTPPVTTSVKIYSSDGVLLDTLSVSAGADADVNLTLVSLGGGNYRLNLTAGDILDSYEYYSLLHFSAIFSGNWGDLTEGNTLKFDSGKTVSGTLGITAPTEEEDTPIIERLLEWIDMLAQVPSKLIGAYNTFRDSVKTIFNFDIFNGFVNFLSGLWSMIPNNYSSYMIAGLMVLLSANIVWKGGIV